MENLWSLKTLLQGFKIKSGLKVNFFKSCLIGESMSNQDYFYETSYCKVKDARPLVGAKHS